MRIRTLVFQPNIGAYSQFSVPNRHLRVAANRQAVKKLIAHTETFVYVSEEKSYKSFSEILDRVFSHSDVSGKHNERHHRQP